MLESKSMALLSYWVTQKALQLFFSILPLYLSVLGLTQCTPDSFRELKDPYVLYIDSHLSLKTGSKEYYQWVLGRERPRDCSVLELSRNICILHQTFHCSVGLSHPDKCLWFFDIRWLMSNCVIAWSDKRHPNSRGIAALHRNSGSQDGKKIQRLLNS